MSVKRNNERISVELVDKNYYLVEVFEDVDFSIDDLKAVVAFQKEIDDKRYPVLILPHPTAITQIELLKYMAIDEHVPYDKADAFVVSSIAQRILASLYRRFILNSRPTGFFKNKQEAIEWLRQYF